MQPSTEYYLSFYTPLNLDQQIIIRKPYTEGRLGRAIAYAQEKDVLSDALNNNEAVLMATTTVFAACVVTPSLVKPILGQQNSKKFKSHPSLSIKATLIAFCAFQSVSILYHLKEIQSSPAYQGWKNNRIHMIKDASIITFLEKDDILRHLLCPISGTIPEIPATMESCKYAYDYDAAIAWIDQNPETPLPGSLKIITKEKLIFDFPHINSIIKRLEALNFIAHQNTENKIYQLMCVKASSDKESINNLNNLLFISQFIVNTKTATIAELFSGCMTSCEESLIFLNNIQSVCFRKRLKAKVIRYEKKHEMETSIDQMPEVTLQQNELKESVNKQLIGKLELYKMITKQVIDNPSIFTNIMSWFGYDRARIVYFLSREIAMEEDMELLWK